MSDIKKQTHILIDNLTDEQVEHIYNIMRSIKILSIPTVEPDEFDLSLIKEAEDDNKEYTDINNFVRELGLDPNELQRV